MGGGGWVEQLLGYPAWAGIDRARERCIDGF